MSVPEGTPGYKGPKLQFSYDYDRDIIEIEGQEYTGALMRAFAEQGGLKTGTLFRFTRNPDGAFAIHIVNPREGY